MSARSSSQPARRRRSTWPELALWPTQRAFVDSEALYRGFVGGRGSGKSFVGTYDLIRRARPGRLYCVVAPTYPVLRDATLRSFLDTARRMGAVVDFNKNEMLARVGGGQGLDPAEVLFRSADDPELLRGPNLSGAVIDEASLTQRATFDVLIAGLREGGDQGWLTALFTPKGKLHWTYEVFGVGLPDTAIFHARTADNPFLPEQFEAVVRRQYTALHAEQELEGAFLDAAGLMFAVGRVGVVEASPAHATRVRYWDKAGTSEQERKAKKNPNDPDYTAGVLMARGADGIFYVEDVRRGRWSSLARNQVIRQAAELDRDQHRGKGPLQIWVEQEPGSGGKESAEISVRELAGFSVAAERVTGKLPARAEPFAAQVEAGNVRLVRGPWNKDFLDELAAFPTEGVHDDQVAAACGAFNKLANVPTGTPTVDAGPPGATKPFLGPNNGIGRDYAQDWGLFGMGGDR